MNQLSVGRLLLSMVWLSGSPLLILFVGGGYVGLHGIHLQGGHGFYWFTMWWLVLAGYLASMIQAAHTVRDWAGELTQVLIERHQQDDDDQDTPLAGPHTREEQPVNDNDDTQDWEHKEGA